jgi:membrane fusion protein (multidrug efflux system)
MELRPGMFARITAVFGQRDNARVIPEEAIVPQAGRQYVFRLVEGPDQDTKIAQRVEVKVGLRQPGRVEITQGLQPGEVVVTAGQQRIQKDGMPVRVIELNRTAATPSQPAASAPQGISAAAPAPKATGANPCGASRA